MARRHQVSIWKGDHFTLRIGSTVKSLWGGQVPGQKPRTKRGTITKLMSDGGFSATCDKTGKLFKELRTESFSF